MIVLHIHYFESTFPGNANDQAVHKRYTDKRSTVVAFRLTITIIPPGGAGPLHFVLMGSRAMLPMVLAACSDE